MPDTFEKSWSVGEFVEAIAFTADDCYGALGLVDGSCLLVDLATNETQRVPLHKNGAVLCLTATAAGDGFLSGGDDGTLVRFIPEREPEVIATHQGKWIEHIAVSAKGKVEAYSVGKDVYIVGRDKPFLHPSTVGGLDFSPNGKRLAVSHFNGASLWWVAAKEGSAQVMSWAGMHQDVLWHPSGDYLLTTLQDNTIHGWKMIEKGDFRMAGYAAKVGSVAFTDKGRWLVTSGADQVVCWPFFGGGPQGKAPLVLGVPEGLPCVCVSTQPTEELMAAGFASGRVVIAPVEDCLPIELLPPAGIAISALKWSPTGKHLLVGDEEGTVYHFTTQSIIKGTEHLMGR